MDMLSSAKGVKGAEVDVSSRCVADHFGPLTLALALTLTLILALNLTRSLTPTRSLTLTLTLTLTRWVADLFGPNAAEDSGDEVTKVMGKVASFYSAPMVKFLLRFLIHLINLVLYTMLISNFVTSGDIDRETGKCKASFPYPEDGTSLGGQRWECMMGHGRMPLMSHLRPIEVWRGPS